MATDRILHIITSLGYGNGIVNVVMNYYRNINRDLFQFDFLYLFEEKESYKEEILELGGRVYKINPPSLKNIYSYQLNLINFIDQYDLNYSIVHMHEPALLAMIIPAFKKKNKCKVIAHSHSTAYSSHPLKALRNKITSLPINKYTDYYASCSQEAASFWFKRNINDTYIIKNAIDCNKYSLNINVRNNIREQLELTDNIVFGHVGRFSKEKNHDFLIDVFYKVTTHFDNARLLLIGSGDRLESIKNKVNDLGLERKVVFIGNKRNVQDYYNAMDIFLFPSLSEGFGTVVLEAQISGLKCFVSKSVNSDVAITNNDTIFLNLEDGPDSWTQVIINNINYQRGDRSSIAASKGYCIKSEAINLERYYGRLL